MSKDPSGDSSLQLLFVFGSEVEALLLSKSSYKWDSGNFREAISAYGSQEILPLCVAPWLELRKREVVSEPMCVCCAAEALGRQTLAFFVTEAQFALVTVTLLHQWDVKAVSAMGRTQEK